MKKASSTSRLFFVDVANADALLSLPREILDHDMEDSGRRSQARRQAGKIQWRESVDRLSIYVGWMDCTASRIHGLTHSRVSGQSRAEINKITIQHATASGRGWRQKVSMQPCTKAILLHPTENLCFLALLYFGLIDSLVQGTLLGCMVEVPRLSKSLDLHESTHGRMPIPPVLAIQRGDADWISNQRAYKGRGVRCRTA